MVAWWLIHLTGYNVHRRDRQDGRQGGGVAVYVKQGISCSLQPQFNHTSLEVMWLLFRQNLMPREMAHDKMRSGQICGRIWMVTICGSLRPICGSVITVGLRLGVGLGLGFGSGLGSGSGLELRLGFRVRFRVENCCIQTAGEGDKMRINHVIKTDQ